MIIKAFHRLDQRAMLIRNKVFVEEQGFFDEFDDIDEIATHYIAFDGDLPIATCRIYRQGEKYIFGRLAVLPQYRRKGLGAEMMKTAEHYVISQGGTALYLHSQCRAAGFYEKQGYSQFGEIELEENCPHIWMSKQLNK